VAYVAPAVVGRGVRRFGEFSDNVRLFEQQQRFGFLFDLFFAGY
jgi:hypothetical protein